ncbi:MAG: hypothetical protein R3350_01610 [Saprospiraceae bacterium]|nr:hypothetical protein [Saprospiraceae bacterium]
MKTIIIRHLLNLFFLLATATFGLASVASIPSVSIEKLGYGKKVSIVVEDVHSGAAFAVRDEEGVVLLRQKALKKGTFSRIINLDRLPEGNYELVISTRTKEVVQPFQIENGDLEINEKLRQQFFAPTVRMAGDFLDVNHLNQRIGDVELTLMDKSGEVVFTDQIDNVLTVERRYRLTQFKPGAYRLKINTPYKAYYEDLKIK